LHQISIATAPAIGERHIDMSARLVNALVSDKQMNLLDGRGIGKYRKPHASHVRRHKKLPSKRLGVVESFYKNS